MDFDRDLCAGRSDVAGSRPADREYPRSRVVAAPELADAPLVIALRSPAPVTVFPAARQPHGGENESGHRISLREIAPQLAGSRINVLGEQTVTIAVIERVDEEVARRLAPSERPQSVDQPEPADQEC